jgi:uncharacterized protein YeaO (DUF488 family)
MTVDIERAYHFRKTGKPADSYVILVDRMWPRGIKKEELEIDEWAKDLAPSDDLRKWFGHDPEKWDDFQRKYKEELKGSKEDLDRIRKTAKEKKVILLYGAKDEKHNQAVVLKELLGS